MSSRACRTRPPHRSWPSPLSPRWTRSLLPTSNPSSAETSAPHPRREMRERRHVSGSWATAPFRQKLTRTATGLGPPRRPSSAIRDWSTRSARTVHKNARPGEPEGLPDLTFRTLTRPARSCQAAAERRSPVGSSRRGSVSRFRQNATSACRIGTSGLWRRGSVSRFRHSATWCANESPGERMSWEGPAQDARRTA
jgi:hypothetical protein